MFRALRVFIFVSTIALGSCSSGTGRTIAPTILSTRGETVWFLDGSENLHHVQQNSKIGNGCVLRSSTDGQLDLVLIPGVLTRVLANSELKIENLNIEKDGNETAYSIRNRVATVELRRGRLVVAFEGAANFTIKTAAVTIDALPSCLISIEVDQNKTRLNCVRGDVRAKPRSGPETTVEAGYFREWPSPRDATAASEDRAAENEAMLARDAAMVLEESSAQRRDRLPVE